MKQKLLIFFLIALPGFSQAPKQADKEELTKMLHTFLDGASRNDKAIHDNFWAEDLIYTSSTGTRFGKKEIMAGFDDIKAVTNDTPSTVYTAEDNRIQQYDDMAVVAFKMKATTGSEVQYYLNSGTFLKRNGKWEVVNWQATRVP